MTHDIAPLIIGDTNHEITANFKKCKKGKQTGNVNKLTKIKISIRLTDFYH